jgi:hypothetical protein
LGIFLCLTAAGCGSKGQFGSHPPIKASGQVLVNGKPAAGVELILFHQADWGESTASPTGFTDKEGRYKLSTYYHEDGAPAGRYKVRAVWPSFRRGLTAGPDKLAGKYADQNKSGIEVEINDGVNVLPEIELTAENLVERPKRGK